MVESTHATVFESCERDYSATMSLLERLDPHSLTVEGMSLEQLYENLSKLIKQMEVQAIKQTDASSRQKVSPHTECFTAWVA